MSCRNRRGERTHSSLSGEFLRGEDTVKTAPFLAAPKGSLARIPLPADNRDSGNGSGPTPEPNRFSPALVFSGRARFDFSLTIFLCPNRCLAEEANEARDRVRGLGFTAIISATLALIAIATKPVWPNGCWTRWVALVIDLGGHTRSSHCCRRIVARPLETTLARESTDDRAHPPVAFPIIGSTGTTN
jgi:hypothetical protein